MPLLFYIAICGKNPKLKELYENYVKDKSKEDIVKVIDFSNEIPELMAISNLVITKPGRTYYI